MGKRTRQYNWSQTTLGTPDQWSQSLFAAAYYQIDVTDNAIRFEEKYTLRIFQVFQRLHGKGEFAGMDVGLAIYGIVVTSHGGAIVARARSGSHLQRVPAPVTPA